MSNKKSEAEKVEETKVEETKVAETKDAPVVKAYDPDELVDYMAPLMAGHKQKDVFVAVNGDTCVIKRGVPVKVKRKFYDALMNAQAQQVAAYQAMVQIQKQGDKPAAEM